MRIISFKVFCASAFLCLAPQVFAELVKVSIVPPKNLSAKDTVHILGTFNGWAMEGDAAVKLNAKDGMLSATVDFPHGDVLFTFVKNGNWMSVPATKTGNKWCDIYEKITENTKSLSYTIPAWKDDAPLEQASSTHTGNIISISDFDMPQLKRTGNISIYLPPSYDAKQNTKFPVLYVLDGQNIFDARTAFSDEWRIDESVEMLIKEHHLQELIVVAIANGPRRWNEYTPWDFVDWGGKPQQGEGKFTMQFIKETLKPYIDNNYRTLKNAKSTGLAGSSLGGMMALFAAMEYSETFGFVAAFSPSLSLTNGKGEPIIIAALKATKSLKDVKIYFDMGKVEFNGYKEVDELETMLLARLPKEGMLKVVRDDTGRHCEVDWAKRFPGAITWLMN
jgi:pullulanase